MDTRRDNQDTSRPSGSRWKWALGGFLAIITFFLWTEHRAHLFGALPYLLLAACPLMHVFMHRGHHSHGSKGGRRDDQENGSHNP